MLFDAEVAITSPLVVLALTVAFVVGKAVLATLSTMALRFPARVALLSGVGLAQFGEFGFILAQAAIGAGLVTSVEIQPLLAAGILSMFLTPVLIQISPHVSAGSRLLRPLERLLGARGVDEASEDLGKLTDHVIVVGYGVSGRLLCGALKTSEIPYVVIELNADTVRKASAQGEHIYYGDVSSPEALLHAGARSARAVVLLINDPQAARRGAAAVRQTAPDVTVLMRTRYLSERPMLEQLATDIVYDEIEAGVEMLARVLRRSEVPRNLIHERLEEARRETQGSARPATVPRRRLGEMRDLEDLKIEKVLLRAGDRAIGRSPRELAVRHATRALVVAVRRGDQLLDPPDPDDPLQEGDLVYLVGGTEAVERACTLLTQASEAPPASP
jgi:CPA2 family monovalent cation:H+ antiporter-2